MTLMRRGERICECWVIDLLASGTYKSRFRKAGKLFIKTLYKLFIPSHHITRE